MATHTPRAQRRLVAAVRTSSARTGAVLTSGTVDGVTPGAAADGNTALTVTVGATTGIPAPYLKAYTPTLHDVVAVLLIDGSPLVLGHVIGLPSF